MLKFIGYLEKFYYCTKFVYMLKYLCYFLEEGKKWSRL